MTEEEQAVLIGKYFGSVGQDVCLKEVGTWHQWKHGIFYVYNSEWQ